MIPHIKWGFFIAYYKINFKEIDKNQDEYIISILEFVVDWIESHILHKDVLITSK